MSIVSRPYKVSSAICEKCVFGSGRHTCTSQDSTIKTTLTEKNVHLSTIDSLVGIWKLRDGTYGSVEEKVEGFWLGSQLERTKDNRWSKAKQGLIWDKNGNNTDKNKDLLNRKPGWCEGKGSEEWPSL